MDRTVLWLMYKRARPGMGLTFGIALMYAIVAGSLPLVLVISALGFLLIAFYGDLYNDYWDYEEDARNERRDKFTTQGLLSREQSKKAGFLFALGGLGLVLLANQVLFLFAVLSFILHTCYSHPAIRFKGSLLGYCVFSSIFLFLPFGFLAVMEVTSFLFTAVFGFFWFFQFLYILCQKDSTDMGDDRNVFIVHGWKRSTLITGVIGFFSSAFLLILSLMNTLFLILWMVNAVVKFLNVRKIGNKTINKTERYRFSLLEFSIPYLYLGGLFV